VPPELQLTTARLRLRRWRHDDLDPYAALNADPEVMRHFPSTLTRAQSAESIAVIEARFDDLGYGLWAVEVPGVAPFVGFVGLNPVTFAAPFTPAVEVGWRLARGHWGHGYATEGGRAALAFGFGALGLEQIVSFTTPGNTRSWNVMEKLGMTRDPADDFEHPLIAEGHPLRRHVLYRISRTTSTGSLSSRSPR
jgi:RimJ/RimL family protein N-acetyltransferase